MTKIVGILNITPDSFSDGGQYTNLITIIKRIQIMVLEGVDIIDIGAQSTRPDAHIISTEEEWNRLKPILTTIKDYNFNVGISIDSFNSEIIKRALDYNITIINDVSGFRSDKMKALAISSGKKIVFMHSLSVPVDKNNFIPENVDIISLLSEWLEKKILELEKAGIKKSNLIFDPGIGFGKTSKQSLKIVMNAEKFKNFGVEVMIGHSEKSFLTLFTDKPAGQRGEETKRFSKILADKNIDYIRVHDIAGNKKAIGNNEIQ